MNVQVNRNNALVFVIGIAVGLLLLAFSVVPTQAMVVGYVVAALIWALRVAPRPDMVFSLIGIGLGVLLALVVPGIRAMVEPSIGYCTALVLLASVA